MLGEDVGGEIEEPSVSSHKRELMWELKALGVNPKQK